MRAELRELLSRKEDLSEHEIDFTVLLCSDVVQSHWGNSHRRFETVDVQWLDQETTEALSDQNFKTVYEIQFIWQMGLWRIIALLDGLLSQWFPDLARKPLQSKLDALEFRSLLGAKDTAEIREWIRLRNVLSHRPVEGHTLSHQLSLTDLQELARAARTLLAAVRHARVRAADA